MTICDRFMLRITDQQKNARALAIANKGISGAEVASQALVAW